VRRQTPVLKRPEAAFEIAKPRAPCIASGAPRLASAPLADQRLPPKRESDAQTYAKPERKSLTMLRHD
jgi:hypothetical protein